MREVKEEVSLNLIMVTRNFGKYFFLVDTKLIVDSKGELQKLRVNAKNLLKCKRNEDRRRLIVKLNRDVSEDLTGLINNKGNLYKIRLSKIYNRTSRLCFACVLCRRNAEGD